MLTWQRPIDYEMIENKDITLREIKERVDRHTEHFVEHMRTIEPDIEQKPAVFFAVPELIFSGSLTKIDKHILFLQMEHHSNNALFRLMK